MFTIEAFVVGDDYDLERDELEELLDSKGPHTLVHPYRGIVDVSLTSKYRVSESADEQGGVAKYTLSLIVDGGPIAPTVADTASAVEGASANLGSQLENDFGDAFSLANAVNEVVTAVNGAISDLSVAILVAKGKVNAIANVPLSTLAALDSLADQMTDLIATPRLLAQSLFSNLKALLAALPGADDDGDGLDRQPGLAAGTGLELLGDAVSFTPKPAIGSGVQSKVEAGAKAQVAQLYKVAMVSAVADAVVNMEFDSGDQAQLFAAQFAEQVDAVALADDDIGDQLFLALETTKAAIFDHLTKTAQDLPRVTRHYVAADTPALVLAYELLGDATKAGDLIRRNKIRNPNAVPGGTWIEVLIDG